MELCVTKLSQDWFPLLELLAMATNPHCKFHIYNGTRPSETVPAGVQLAEDELFARPPDPRSPKVRRCLCRVLWYSHFMNLMYDLFEFKIGCLLQILAIMGKCWM